MPFRHKIIIENIYIDETNTLVRIPSILHEFTAYTRGAVNVGHKSHFIMYININFSNHDVVDVQRNWFTKKII